MQVGIDVGATKIESVVLEKDGQEKHRSRICLLYTSDAADE